MRDRSWRRAQRDRSISRAERRASALGWWGHAEDRTAWIRRSAVTPHPCSNYCCGNPRKWFGHLTRQELVASINQREQSMVDIVEQNTHQHHECENTNSTWPIELITFPYQQPE